MSVQCGDAFEFLLDVPAGTIDHIITSPPYSGLPGRANATRLVSRLLTAALSSLTEHGTATLIVGSSERYLLEPYEIATSVSRLTAGQLTVHSLYVWDRTGSLSRSVGEQSVSHDVIIHIRRTGIEGIQALWPASVVRTQQPGFNYGSGVSTPPDLAAYLIDAASEAGQLIVDPFCGLGEIGVQAVNQGRRFQGFELDQHCAAIAAARIADVEAATA